MLKAATNVRKLALIYLAETAKLHNFMTIIMAAQPPMIL